MVLVGWVAPIRVFTRKDLILWGLQLHSRKDLIPGRLALLSAWERVRKPREFSLLRRCVRASDLDSESNRLGVDDGRELVDFSH